MTDQPIHLEEVPGYGDVCVPARPPRALPKPDEPLVMPPSFLRETLAGVVLMPIAFGLLAFAWLITP